jgi:hypothetical protein
VRDFSTHLEVPVDPWSAELVSPTPPERYTVHRGELAQPGKYQSVAAVSKAGRGSHFGIFGRKRGSTVPRSPPQAPGRAPARGPWAKAAVMAACWRAATTLPAPAAHAAIPPSEAQPHARAQHGEAACWRRTGGLCAPGGHPGTGNMMKHTQPGGACLWCGLWYLSPQHSSCCCLETTSLSLCRLWGRGCGCGTSARCERIRAPR